jgi:hypothetical protein
VEGGREGGREGWKDGWKEGGRRRSDFLGGSFTIEIAEE